MLIGHKDKVELFTDLVKRGTLRHAYLFFGDSQVGKRAFADHLAKFLEYGEFVVDRRPLIDALVIEINNDSSIGIEKLREFKRFLFQRPLRSPWRLAIIDDAELLTPHAQASLLKFVEEAPERTVFVFITHNPHTLIPPLVSRLTKLHFRRLSTNKLAAELKEHFKIPSIEAASLAQQSFGRIGRALCLRGDEEEDTLEKCLRDAILKLYLKDKVRNVKKLSWLVDRETKIKRLQLNPKLQKKAVDVELMN